MHLPCIYHASTMHLPCIYQASTRHLPCIYCRFASPTATTLGDGCCCASSRARCHVEMWKCGKQPPLWKTAAVWENSRETDRDGQILADTHAWTAHTMGRLTRPLDRPEASASSPSSFDTRASARASSGRPPASASFGQLADVFWLAGLTGLVSHVGELGFDLVACDVHINPNPNPNPTLRRARLRASGV